MANPSQNWNKAKDEVKAAAGEVRRDVQEAATGVVDRAKEMASNVADRAKDAAATVGQRAGEGVGAVAGGMSSLAGSIRENLPEGGVLRTAGSGVADALESGGRYLKEEGFKGMADDLTELIRRNPIPALLVGVGLGFLIARSTSRS
jgi:hypothetical protein